MHILALILWLSSNYYSAYALPHLASSNQRTSLIKAHLYIFPRPMLVLTYLPCWY